jgi:hypothetical protein
MLLEAIRSADRRDWARARDYLRASLELEPIADISRALKRVETAAHHPDAMAVKVDLRLYLGQVLELPDLPFMDASPGMEELSDSGTDIDELFPPSDAAPFVVSNPFSAEAHFSGRDSATLVPGALNGDDLLATLTPTLPPGGSGAQIAEQLTAQIAAMRETVQPLPESSPREVVASAPTAALSAFDAAFADLASDLMDDPFGFDGLAPFPPPAEMPTLPVQPPTPDLIAAIAALRAADSGVRLREPEAAVTAPSHFAAPMPYGDPAADTMPPMDFGAIGRFDNDATLPPMEIPALILSGAVATASTRSSVETPVHEIPALSSHTFPEPQLAATVPSLPIEVPGPSDAELLVATPTLFAAPSEIRNASLAPKEMYFVSLMDGATVVEDLLDMSNVPRQEAFALLRRLLSERIIRIV